MRFAIGINPLTTDRFLRAIPSSRRPTVFVDERSSRAQIEKRMKIEAATPGSHIPKI